MHDRNWFINVHSQESIHHIRCYPRTSMDMEDSRLLDHFPGKSWIFLYTIRAIVTRGWTKIGQGQSIHLFVIPEVGCQGYPWETHWKQDDPPFYVMFTILAPLGSADFVNAMARESTSPITVEKVRQCFNGPKV